MQFSIEKRLFCWQQWKMKLMMSSNFHSFFSNYGQSKKKKDRIGYCRGWPTKGGQRIQQRWSPQDFWSNQLRFWDSRSIHRDECIWIIQKSLLILYLDTTIVFLWLHSKWERKRHLSEWKSRNRKNIVYEESTESTTWLGTIRMLSTLHMTVLDAFLERIHLWCHLVECNDLYHKRCMPQSWTMLLCSIDDLWDSCKQIDDRIHSIKRCQGVGFQLFHRRAQEEPLLVSDLPSLLFLLAFSALMKSIIYSIFVILRICTDSSNYRSFLSPISSSLASPTLSISSKPICRFWRQKTVFRHNSSWFIVYQPKTVVFKSYSKDDLLNIIQQRIELSSSSLPPDYQLFTPQALQLCCRKVVFFLFSRLTL